MALGFIKRVQYLPYVPGGNSWSGIDCFGLVELWHRELLGIEVVDRGEHSNTPEGMAGGYRSTSDFIQQSEPSDHCVIIMKSAESGTIVRYGHCGMHWQGNVYHIDREGGFRCQPLQSVLRRVTDYRKHKDAINL